MLSPRPYVAAAAASVLVGLYFMPSASASPSSHAPARTATSRTTTGRTGGTAAGSQAADRQAGDSGASADEDGSGGLADTGAMNTKPYLSAGACSWWRARG